MDRRSFITTGVSAALAAKLAVGQTTHPSAAAHPAPPARPKGGSASARNNLNHHRIGVNYTPSNNWYFC